MTQEEKDLLIKDLCCRLPYGVKVQYHHIQEIITDTLIDINMFGRVNITGHIKDVCDVKPYLFPLSSMTKEQESYLYFNTQFRIDMFGDLVVKIDEDTDISDYVSLIGWLLKNHFDIYGLIPKGLAIDATGKTIYPCIKKETVKDESIEFPYPIGSRVKLKNSKRDVFATIVGISYNTCACKQYEILVDDDTTTRHYPTELMTLI